MTMKSMTGYASQSGHHQAPQASFDWTWDVRSVNGKSLDLRLRVPTILNELDQPARKLLSSKLARGNVSASLTFETALPEGAISINEQALASILALSKKLHEEEGLEPISVDGLIAARGVLDSSKSDDIGDSRPDLVKAIMADFETSIDALVVSRQKEGAALSDILIQIVDEIENLTKQARVAPERQAAAIQAKIKEQVATLTEGENDFSEERLHQEALLLAAKADIREEIDRLDAHVASARDLFSLAEPIGRRLDFLTQEFNREANTLCSKANDIALTKIGLALKAAIDQLREQVQNVE